MKATNGQIIAEANRRRSEKGMDGLMLADFIIEVMREGWAPPEVDPDVLAFREWSAAQGLDPGPDVLLRDTFLAGARMAREQERERAKVLVEYVEIHTRRLDGVGGRAVAALAKYRGEA